MQNYSILFNDNFGIVYTLFIQEFLCMLISFETV